MHLLAPAVAFLNIEEKKMHYFKCQNCADHILFQCTDVGWVLHVIEMKKTVKVKEWNEKIKEQFKGAILNGLAISGFLGINFSEIRCYTAYRYDKIAGLTHSPDVIELKLPTGSTQKTSFEEWNAPTVKIALDKDMEYVHIKIRLTEDAGVGNITI